MCSKWLTMPLCHCQLRRAGTFCLVGACATWSGGISLILLLLLLYYYYYYTRTRTRYYYILYLQKTFHFNENNDTDIFFNKILMINYFKFDRYLLYISTWPPKVPSSLWLLIEIAIAIAVSIDVQYTIHCYFNKNLFFKEKCKRIK